MKEKELTLSFVLGGVVAPTERRRRQARTQSEAATASVTQAQQQAAVMQNFARALETQLSEERVFR